jgi:hypothetical protein
MEKSSDGLLEEIGPEFLLPGTMPTATGAISLRVESPGEGFVDLSCCCLD